MIRKFKGRVKLDVGHVAADAVAFLSVIRMQSCTVVTGLTLLVIEGRVIAPSVLVCRVASCAGKLARSEAATFHQAQRLEANILQLSVVSERFDPMTIAAELHLGWGTQLSRI
jgi:hypothetical protein